MKILPDDYRLVRPSITAQFVDECLAGSREKGIRDESVLSSAGVNPAILKTPQTYISIWMYNKILTAVGRTLRDEGLGFLNRPLPPGTFALFCEAAAGQPDISGVVAYANRFFRLFTDQMSWLLKADKKSGMIRLRADLKLEAGLNPKHMTEAVLLVPYRLVSWLIGEQLPLAHTWFSIPDSSCREQHHYLFGKNITYSAGFNAMDFNMSTFNHPIIRKPSDVSYFLRSAPEWLLLNPSGYPFTRKVRQELLSQGGPAMFPSFEAVAGSLNISHQHLWRKLNQEGTSYRIIKDQLRRDITIHYLSTSDTSIAEIAAGVGYTDERHFYRAFRKWTGFTPGSYRELLRG